jgi:hypothetical protein
MTATYPHDLPDGATRRDDAAGGEGWSGTASGKPSAGALGSAAPSGDRLGLGRYLLDDDTTRLVGGWLQQLAGDRPVPTYGSRKWLRAPRDLQIAACILAAEAHRRDVLFAMQALEDERAAQRTLLDQADARAFADLAGRIVAFDEISRVAAGLARGETHAELQRRRAVPYRPFPRPPQQSDHSDQQRTA